MNITTNSLINYTIKCIFKGLAVTTMGNQVKRMSSLTDVAQACEPVVNHMTVVKSEGLIHMVMCTLYTIGHLGLSFFIGLQ